MEIKKKKKPYQNIKIKARVNEWHRDKHKCLALSLGMQITSYRKYSLHMHGVCTEPIKATHIPNGQACCPSVANAEFQGSFPRVSGQLSTFIVWQVIYYGT